VGEREVWYDCNAITRATEGDGSTSLSLLDLKTIFPSDTATTFFVFQRLLVTALSY